MARIRSTHASQWTDEDFVQMSYPARLLTLAVRNEADDQGVFEWKPVTIKMRLMPVDNVDIEELLAEMEEHNQVRRFESDGRQYGAIRNFRKFQRPKSPNQIHPLPADFRNYVGLSDDDFGNDGGSTGGECSGASEIAPQMEEGGGNGRRESPPVVPPEGDEPHSGKGSGSGGNGRSPPKQTLRQALDANPNLPAECRATTERLFAEKRWDLPDLSLVWEEFEAYWLGDGARRKKVDWPRTFYNRCLEVRTRPAYQRPAEAKGVDYDKLLGGLK